MKAFLFSDLHCSYKQLHNMLDLVKSDPNITCLIFTGDVVNMGEPVGFTNDFILVLENLALPFFWVPGNNDFGRSYYKLNAKYKSVEGRVVGWEKLKITGVGGSPASWAGQYAGENMVDQEKIGGSIFLSHVPPPGVFTWQKYDDFPITEGATLSDNLKNRNSSKKRLSDAPLIHICGHLHYRWGVAFLGQTKVIQLASLETGHYAIMNLETLQVEFKRF